jgi:transposase
VDPNRLVFIDEAGSNISMTRRFARGPCGQRVGERVPRNRGTVTTMLGGINARQGLQAVMTIEGATDGDVFVSFLEDVLGPTLRSGDLVVMDNAAAHRNPRVVEVLARFGAAPVYLPPYSPDLNPIELAWAVLKDFLRSAKARTLDALNSCIGWGMELIDGTMARNFFRHCGYAAQLT